MSVLLLRLAGPMQAWGTQSRFSARDTGREPSRSGVVGLLSAALGRKRHEPLDDFHPLKMAVRVDAEGELRRDFHTAGGGRLSTRPLTVGGDAYGVIKASGAKGDTVISQRDWLADANFLVALAGDGELLARLDAAVANPIWPLALGRKAFVPGMPVQVPGGVRSGDDPEAALRECPWIAPEYPMAVPAQLRLIVETDDPTAADGHPHDVPLSFDPRRFTTRHTITRWIEPDDLQRITEHASREDSCI